MQKTAYEMRISDWISDACSSILIALGGFAQDAAHDLARAGLGQTRRELDGIGGGDRADLLAHPLRQRLAQIVVGGDADVERHISINALTLDVVGEADHRGLRSEEHTSELQSLMRSSYAVFCLNKKKQT